MLASTRPSHAAGFAVLEYGARRTAMGAVIGRPDDLSAIYHNPAGLILSPGTNIFLNAGVAVPTSDYQLRPWDGSSRFINAPIDQNGYYPRAVPTRAFGILPMIVASTDFGTDKLVGGVGIYFPQATGGAFDPQGVTRFHLYDALILSGSLTAALAYRPHPMITLSAAGSLLYVRIAAMRKFFPLVCLKDDGPCSSSERVDLSGLIGGDSILDIAGDEWQGRGTFSLLFQPFKRLTIGAVLMTRVNVQLEGDISVRTGSDALRSIELTGQQSTGIIFPWVFQFGINLDITDWLEIGAETRWFLYRQFVEQRTEITGPLASILPRLVTQKGYHDSIHTSGGIRVSPPQLPGLDIMLGFHYDRTPAPDETVSIEQPTFNHVGMRAGFRYRLTNRWRLSLTYVHYNLLERGTDHSVHQNPPSNFRAAGTNNFVTAVAEFALTPPQESAH